MSRELLLGLDLGTTSCKAAVVTPEGEEIAHGQSPLHWTQVPTGAEIASQGFVDCALAAAREALASLPDGFRVAGVGVSGMAETGVLLDRHGEPVIPSIAWHDSRGEDEAARLEAEIPAFRATTGLSSRALRTVAKYRWLRDNVEETARGVRWLSVGEWVVHGLGGEQGAELSLASRTGWLDLHARGWWDETLAWSGAPAGLLPEPAFAGTPLGTVGDVLPQARGAVLAVGGHDHLSAAVGAGAVGEGEVLDSWGTAEAFVRAVAPLDRERVAQAVDDEIMVGWHAVPDRQNLLGAMRSGAALGRVMALLGVGREGRDALERAALEVDAEAGGIDLRGLNGYRIEHRQHRRRPLPGAGVARRARVLRPRRARPARPHGARGRPAHAPGDGGRLVGGRRGARGQGGARGAVRALRGRVHGRPRRRAHRGAGGGAGLSSAYTPAADSTRPVTSASHSPGVALRALAPRVVDDRPGPEQRRPAGGTEQHGPRTAAAQPADGGAPDGDDGGDAEPSRSGQNSWSVPIASYHHARLGETNSPMLASTTTATSGLDGRVARPPRHSTAASSASPPTVTAHAGK